MNDYESENRVVVWAGLKEWKLSAVGRVGEEAQAVIAERHVLSTDEHGFKSQLDHVLNDLEYDIKA